MSATKDRHGCLTAWLVLMIIVNALTAVTYSLHVGNTVALGWVRPVLAVGSMANVIFAVALLKWKKWGFLGFLGTTIVVLVINLRIGIKPIFAILGLFGIVILYALLQIGGDRKGWNQLE